MINSAGKRLGYIRVSTIDQKSARQLEGVEMDKRFIDYASGSTTNRPQLKALIDYAREDDIVLVHSMDRLARNVKDLINLIDSFIKKKIKVQFIKENLIFNGKDSPMSKLLLMILGAVAEFEREIILERQKEGIQIAKRAGKYKGKKKILNAEKIQLLKQQLETSRKSISQLAKDAGISRTTFYKYIINAKEKNV